MNNSIKNLYLLGQSLWYDNLQRRLLTNGDIAALIERGEIRGMTSNPSIFNNAIAKSKDYDSAILPMAKAGANAEDIFWNLAVEDINTALNLFAGVYEKTNGNDGFVSIEVNPFYANDTSATINQVRYLWSMINKPNLMIKIPATVEGLPAIRQMTSEGININITLIFSIDRYLEVIQAYLNGIKDRLKIGKPVDNISSVASFFVSRVDSKIDERLPENSSLLGKAAIANTKLAYMEFEKIFKSADFEELQSAGCKIQRPLWASTSTKNPTYSDTRYIDELIGPNTVNTIPPATLDAFRDHGKAELTVTKEIESAHKVISDLSKLGIPMEEVTGELEVEGVKAFKDAFTSLLETLEFRSKQID